MGNVQSETTQESESAKDGEEKANPERSKPDRVQSSSTKHDSGNPSPEAPEPKAASPPLSSEPGGGDRQAGAAEMGKNHSKKSKLKLSSMWAQNAASGGMKEASLCDQDTGAEKRGLACLSRADLQGGQTLGNIFQEEPKGLKAALRPPQGAGAEARDLGAKRAPAKGKGKPEGGHPDKNTEGPLLLQPEKLAELDRAVEAPKDMVEREVCWTQHTEACAKEYLENEEQVSEASIKKQAVAMTEKTESSKMIEEVLVGPRSLNERSPNSPSPFSCMVLPGGKKAFLSWIQKEKEQTCHRDNAPGREGDSKDPALVALLPEELANASSGPIERSQAVRNETKAELKYEGLGAEAVSSETMQELLEKGLNFLYKVTIQPGQWPPSIKAVKQKPSVISSGISYADVLKQCPQKKSPAGPPVLPKALNHLTAAGKKLPSFKGLERSNPEDFSSLSHLFLEHFKKVTPPKEPTTSHAPMQQMVTFFEEFSPSNTKRTEWQRPRPPTPYPQRRKTQGRKLPKFGTAMSQVVAFLESDPKCDWLLHDDSQASLDEAMVAAEEGGKEHLEPPVGVNKGAEEAPSSSPPVASLSLAWEISTEVDETPQRSRRRLQGLEEGAKETSPLKIGPFSTAWGLSCPLAPTQSLQKEEDVVMPLLNPVPHSSREVLEVPSPAASAPRSLCVSIGLIPDQKTPAAVQARPKIRKQGSTTPKSKEKLKASGQPKAKPPKGKGQKQWPRGYGMTSPLRLEGVPLFPPFEKVARPFYFGEPLETPLSLDKPAGIEQDATSAQDKPVQDREADQSPAHHWPAFQVANSCSMKCYCKHRDQRKLPKNVMAWLNPSTNHLAEPPWVATAMLAVSLVAGTKFCLDSFDQQHVAKED
ncbi:gametogenetin [Anolis carolinensis]|uniref:gametogenetin n=1 Tax=Anolis carolinensis TaxID=28377 RepID=UPI002F2B86C8